MALAATIHEYRDPVTGPAVSAWTVGASAPAQQVIDDLHQALHHLMPDVVACSYVPVGCAPELLCGKPHWTTALLFERLAGNVLGSNIAIEVQRGANRHVARFAAMLPVEREGRVIGRFQILADTAPDMDALGRLSVLAATKANARCGAVANSIAAGDAAPADRRPDPPLHRFTADPGKPTIRSLLEQVSQVLRGSVVLQTAQLVIVEAVGPSERVALEPSSRHDVLPSNGVPGAVTVLPARNGRPMRAVVPVQSGAGPADHLVAEIASDDEHTRTALEHAATILSWMLAMRADAKGDAAVRRAAIVADLFRSEGLAGVPARAAVLGHDLHVPHRPCVFAPAGEAAGESVLQRLERLVLDEVRRSAHTGPTPLVAVSGEHVVALVPEDDRTTAVLLARRAVQAATHAGLTVTCGLGPTCHGHAELAPGVKQARRAAEVLRRTGRTDRVVSFEDLGVFGLLFSEDDGARLDLFVERWLGRLIEYDAANSAELIQTLEQLLDRSTMVDAANALYIHISTLKYRIKRIGEILGVDMHDPDVNFNLRLALKLLSVRTTLDSRPA